MVVLEAVEVVILELQVLAQLVKELMDQIVEIQVQVHLVAEVVLVQLLQILMEEQDLVHIQHGHLQHLQDLQDLMLVVEVVVVTNEILQVVEQAALVAEEEDVMLQEVVKRQ
jgi:hypothetical protein